MSPRTATRRPDRGPLIVVTPPPTPNGRLHIGHVAGPYLRADLYTRLVRHLGEREAHHVSHIDTYQSYVPKKARQLGRDVDAFMAEIRAGIKADFASFGIAHDLFIDNEAPEYLRFLDSAIEYLVDRLPVADAPARFCADCRTPLFEANLRGFCGRCLHDTFQNVCENCCVSQEYATMLDPVCGSCGGGEHTVSGDRAGQTLLIGAAEIARVTELMGPVLAGHRRLESLFRSLGPHALGLSFATDYGVFPKGVTAALNPWIEIYFGHLYSVLKLTGIDTGQDFEDIVAEFAALETPPTVVNFFGVDNSYYYAFLFPFLSDRLGLPGMLPAALQAGYFLLLNDAKVSSSRNNVIWAADLLAEGDIAALRTNLAACCPEYAAKNYATTHPRSPGSGADPGTTRSEAVQALLDRLRPLTAPDRFSVDELLDVFDKGRLYSAHLRNSAADPAQADAIDAFLTRLAGQLLLG
ncbi:class I tRNA ligase family protein [Streptomyces sp. NPDC048357]|uniref:class I tRNA ligase family protein n=1 Tax=Streptomyces sp. NPDC048357 TaxID=3154719 RepID=UPI0034263D39